MTERSQAPAVPPPLGLYLHYPWCLRRCPYCDFNAHAAEAVEIPQQHYLDRMRQELAHAAGQLEQPRVQTLFFGGGTPSLMPPERVACLLESCRQHFSFLPGAEITLEANPGALESSAPEDFVTAGINRLSLGVQSFDDQCLKALGRIHDAADAERAVHRALQAGLNSVNIDLIYGLPGQDCAMAMRDLSCAIETGVEHISWYQLTLEPNTAFYSSPPQLPDEDEILRMEAEGGRMLKQMGFKQYEVSAWAKPGKACRHNLNYWTFGDYLGVGPGAHSKLSSPDQGVWRWSQLRHPRAWLSALPQTCRTDIRRLDRTHLAFEFFLNSWRLADAPTFSMLKKRTGLNPDCAPVQRGLDRARQKGLLQADSLTPTPRGRRFLDDLTACLID